MAKSSEIQELVSEYCLSTSAHGVSYIISSPHIIKKVGWIIILCGILVGSGYHISVLITSYLEYNFYTSVTLDTGQPLTVREFDSIFLIH